MPPESEAVPSDVAPSKNSTEPVATEGETVAVSETLSPVTDGFGALVSDVDVEPWIVSAASLASLPGFACTSSADARTSAVTDGLLGTVQLNVPELASPLATGSQFEPLSTEYSSTMLFAAMPSASLAVQVIAWLEPCSHDSPPFGDVTATAGAERSTSTVAALPTCEASVALEQSRSTTELIVTVPVPPLSVLLTPSVNSVPLVALEPHGTPSVTPSTVKFPPP